MTLAELDIWFSARAAANPPLKWNTMTAQEQQDFIDVFDHVPYADDELAMLRKYWLDVPNASALSSANDDLPADTRLSSVDTTGGDTVVCVDVLTDAPTFGRAANKLKAWKIIELDPDVDFPAA